MPERRRQALAMLSAVDDGVGRMMSTLREYEIEEDTLIILIGDNGAPLKIHKLDAPGGGPGWDGSLNDPLNGEKGMLTEGGIRVPFLLYWKGKLDGGKLFQHPVISLDVAATALALAGQPADPRLDGVNLIPYLRGEIKGAPHETLFWRWIAQSAVREGKWKYLRGGSREYLFDLEADREEKHDLMARHPEIVDRLRGKLTTWSRELNPPGLETKSMSATWERYYDFYLEGKPAPRPPVSRTPRKASSRGAIRGWVARNGKAEIHDGVLRIRPEGKKGRLFLAANRLELPAPATAVVRLLSQKAGTAGVAWREQGQKGFPPEQVVTFDCDEPGAWREHRVVLPARGKIIHLRLLLPATGADIESVEIRDSDENSTKTWRFKRM
jgi:uncharacterized sulfatase